jgi:hypothetical protein
VTKQRDADAEARAAITVWLILEKGWEYDDSFYNFAGHQRVATICVHASQVPARLKQATATFVRDHLWSLDRFEIQNIPWDEREQRVAAYEQNGMSDDEAVAFAHELGLEPFTVQKVEITPAFLHASGLSEGKRAEVLRSLADELRAISPAAADELES